MKNPFKFFKSSADKRVQTAETVTDNAGEAEAVEAEAAENAVTPTAEPTAEAPDDGFTEWLRSQVRGGIERRERNDIYEAYSIYGADREGRLVCRYYHRYPEHEREFDLSSERVLSFADFNKRLLSELDKGDITLADYNACIERAELTAAERSDAALYEGFTDDEAAALREFCEALDTLTDKEYRGGSGIFRCACRSVAGGDTLNLWFRKPLRHDALLTEVAGVSRTDIGGYDIDNLWIMGVYNRLSEHCSGCRVTLLTSLWSLDRESVYLITAEGFPAVDGALLVAVSDADAFPRFGFYSLDFSNKS